MRALLTLALALTPALSCVAAGADAPSGPSLETEAQPPWRSFVVRRMAGELDARFGVNGRVLVEALTPHRVVSDLRGRTLVVGKTRGAAPRVAVQRLLDNGAIDASWGPQGLAGEPPVAVPSTAIDALPLGDGRALVLGEVQGLNAQTALWIVGSDGRFEPRWLLMTGAPSSRVLSLVALGGDRAMIGLQVGRESGSVLEVHIFQAARDGDALPERIGKQAQPKGWSGAPVLEQRAGKGWWWVDADTPKRPSVRVAGIDEADAAQWAWQQGVVPGPASASAPSSEGGAVFNPFVAKRAADAPAVLKPAIDLDRLDLTLSALALLLAVVVIVRLARRSAA